jgi:hypothetical protein
VLDVFGGELRAEHARVLGSEKQQSVDAAVGVEDGIERKLLGGPTAGMLADKVE